MYWLQIPHPAAILPLSIILSASHCLLNWIILYNLPHGDSMGAPGSVFLFQGSAPTLYRMSSWLTVYTVLLWKAWAL